MGIEIDPARFRFEADGAHARRIYYGDLLVMTQRFNEPEGPHERQRAIVGATSLLRYRWEHASEHERLAMLAAIEDDVDAERDRREVHRAGELSDELVQDLMRSLRRHGTNTQ